jgi:selenide,water dikinase
VLGKLARQHDPKVLVGFDTADDAGVYQVAPDLALVQTVDFFTPIVDDPYTFGQIAATNALSDVYAMGGRPMSALAMVCFPGGGDLAILERILAGGLAKMIEADCTVIGGHSIRDEEIKFGYAVTGAVHPQHVLSNAGARAGDVLVFTKALGTGVIATAVKRQRAEAAWIDAAVISMTTLNRAATAVVTREEPAPGSGEPRRRFAVHGMTDVTGFGLLGHAREMALGANVSLHLRAAAVPLLPGALECVRQNLVPGGLNANRDFAGCAVSFAASVPPEVQTILFDPQTAGGLLIALPAAQGEALVRELAEAGVAAALIGEVVEREEHLISVS